MTQNPEIVPYSGPPIELKWTGDVPSAEIVAKTVEHIIDDLYNMNELPERYFGPIQLTKDENGPSVFVTLGKGAAVFECTYYQTTVWVESSAESL